MSDDLATLPAAPDDEAALRDLLSALRGAGSGDFSERLSTRAGGVMGQIADAYNRMAENNESVSRELSRVAATIGREGRLNERASLGLLEGGFRQSMESVNSLIDDLVRPTTEVGRVLTAVADGDLSTVSLGTSPGAAVTVVFTAGGYPASGDVGTAIDGIEQAEAAGVLVFHAGTALRDGCVVTNGGRILNVTALADTIEEARQRAYEAAELVSFDGVRFRRDIAAEAASREHA